MSTQFSCSHKHRSAQIRFKLAFIGITRLLLEGPGLYFYRLPDVLCTVHYFSRVPEYKYVSKVYVEQAMAPAPAPTAVVQKKPPGQGSETDSNAVVDVLENTLWSRTLGQMSEEIVAALVCQIFEGKQFPSSTSP